MLEAHSGIRDPKLRMPLIWNMDKVRRQAILYVLIYFILFFSVCSFRAAPLAYGSSQARGGIRAAAAGLRHSHSNTGSEPHL